MIKSMNVKALNILDDYPVKDRLVVVNIRSGSKVADKFDDTTMLVINKHVLAIVESTCDAGIPNLINPVNNDGTAIVMNGFYPELWKEGLHRGKYEALVQNAPVVVFRDNNKDNILDYPDVMLDDIMIDRLKDNNNDIEFLHANHKDLIGESEEGFIKYRIQRGMFGINLHRASQWRELLKVGLYSAGCCVVRKPNSYEHFMEAVRSTMKALKLDSIDALYVTERFINNYNK